MLKNRKFNNKAFAFVITLLIIVSALISSEFIYSVSFDSNPSIAGSNNITTSKNINCSWEPSSDTTEMNVSWFLNSNSFRNDTDINENYSIINNANTTKGQTWLCNVSLYNGTDTVSATVSVTVKNTPPLKPTIYDNNSLDIGDNDFIYEDNHSYYTINTTDADNDSLTYGAMGSSEYCNIDSNNGIVDCYPTTESNTTQIIFSVFDGTDGVLKGINFTVIAVNDAPAFSLTNQSINENETLNYTVIATDEENNFPLNFSLVNSSTNLSGVIIEQFDNTNAYIIFDPEEGGDDVGNWTIAINCTDTNESDSKSTIHSFILEINSVNHDPNITYVENISGTQNQLYTVHVNATDIDNADNLTFIITANSCSLNDPWDIETTDTGNNATGLINQTLNNTHVLCNNVTISVTDGMGGEGSYNVVFNLTNVNDPPELHEISAYAGNNAGNNISNLTTYQNTDFVYRVNATDPDLLLGVRANESLTYNANESFINDSMNHATGLVQWSTNSSYSGQYNINITVIDNSSNLTSIIMIINIGNNSPPYFTQNLNFSCAEYDSVNHNQTCFINLSLYVNDSDVGDYIDLFEDNSTLFNVSSTTGIINFTPLQSQVGNHIIRINITDSVGAEASGLIYLEINHTNNPPVLDTINLPVLVADHTTIKYIYASDNDLSFNGINESLVFNFSVNESQSFITLTQLSNTTSYFTFDPLVGDVGYYYMNVSVTDSFNNVSMQSNMTFYVYNISQPPEVVNITPYGRPLINYTNLTGWAVNNITNFPDSLTSINFSENTTVIFNISVNNEQNETLNYSWYLDGSLIGNDSYLSRDFDFFSSGIKNITVIVDDGMYENDSFTWNITIADVNRPPQLLNALDNFTNNDSIDAVIRVSNYFGYYNEDQHFYDPDDDLNSDNFIKANDNETLNLNYSWGSTCDNYVTLEVYDDDGLELTPEEVGTCFVNFTATDPYGETVSSSLIEINISDVDDSGSTETEITTSGGGTSTISLPLPIIEEIEKPKPLDIITPELVVMYKNETIQIPITLKNNWYTDLNQVYLRAETNVTNVSLSYSTRYFAEIPVNGSKKTTLTISNYRGEGSYEIRIIANVTEPDFSDVSTIFINSLETTAEKKQIEAKVTFARDLLSQNPECQELNELLKKAEDELYEGDYKEARRLIDSVVQGCKYMVNKEREAQKPSLFNFLGLYRGYQKYTFMLGGLIISTGILFFIMKKKESEIIEG